MATNFMVGRCSFRVAEVVLLAFRIRPHIPGWHQPGVVAKRSELSAQVMRPDARLHADQARWNIGEPRIDLRARQLLTQNGRAFVVESDDMERVLADVDADRGDDVSAGSRAWHGMLLILAAPCRLSAA